MGVKTMCVKTKWVSNILSVFKHLLVPFSSISDVGVHIQLEGYKSGRILIMAQERRMEFLMHFSM